MRRLSGPHFLHSYKVRAAKPVVPDACELVRKKLKFLLNKGGQRRPQPIVWQVNLFLIQGFGEDPERWIMGIRVRRGRLHSHVQESGSL